MFKQSPGSEDIDEEKVESPARSPLVFSAIPSSNASILSRSVKNQEIKAFLRLVAEGEQDRAEDLLKKTPDLALASSDVTDLSERAFKNITAFQYAVWALDWHMWTMIRKYLSDNEARKQIQAMDTGSWVQQHGQAVSWQNLIDALQRYNVLESEEQYPKAITQWLKQVGGAQRLLPAHVINEYCHSSRSFNPCPDFGVTPLPRTRTVLTGTSKGEWFTASYNGGELGNTFAYCRASWSQAMDIGPPKNTYCVSHLWTAYDLKACQILLDIRICQRDQLFRELNPSLFNQAPEFQEENERNLDLVDRLDAVIKSSSSSVSSQLFVAAPMVFSTPAPDQFAVNVFLKLVADGEQDRAEAILKESPDFALVSGDVTDLSERIFKGITAFQYAVWALDWHMWTMIRKYLHDDQTREQIESMKTSSWVEQYGAFASWQNLLDALQEFINLCKQSRLTEADIQWQKQVGGAQRLLPVHVINEYCHPTRNFAEFCFDFPLTSSLPRSRKTDEGEWFTAYYNGGKLGDKFAVLRYASKQATVGATVATGIICDGVRRMWQDVAGEADLKVCRTLLTTRTQQRDQLFAELYPDKPHAMAISTFLSPSLHSFNSHRSRHPFKEITASQGNIDELVDIQEVDNLNNTDAVKKKRCCRCIVQ